MWILHNTEQKKKKKSWREYDKHRELQGLKGGAEYNNHTYACTRQVFKNIVNLNRRFDAQ